MSSLYPTKKIAVNLQKDVPIAKQVKSSTQEERLPHLKIIKMKMQ